MSRSRKKVPVHWQCGSSKAMKKWKSACNRKLRNQDEVPNGSAYKRLSGDMWDSPSDGKFWFADVCPKLWRK